MGGNGKPPQWEAELPALPFGNEGGRKWELNRWEWEGMGMLKAIPAHL